MQKEKRKKILTAPMDEWGRNFKLEKPKHFKKLIEEYKGLTLKSYKQVDRSRKYHFVFAFTINLLLKILEVDKKKVIKLSKSNFDSRIVALYYVYICQTIFKNFDEENTEVLMERLGLVMEDGFPDTIYQGDDLITFPSCNLSKTIRTLPSKCFNVEERFLMLSMVEKIYISEPTHYLHLVNVLLNIHNYVKLHVYGDCEAFLDAHLSNFFLFKNDSTIKTYTSQFLKDLENLKR